MNLCIFTGVDRFIVREIHPLFRHFCFGVIDMSIVWPVGCGGSNSRVVGQCEARIESPVLDTARCWDCLREFDKT